MDIIGDYLIAFWFVILVAGGGFKLCEWLFRKILKTARREQ